MNCVISHDMLECCTQTQLQQKCYIMIGSCSLLVLVLLSQCQFSVQMCTSWEKDKLIIDNTMMYVFVNESMCVCVLLRIFQMFISLKFVLFEHILCRRGTGKGGGWIKTDQKRLSKSLS